MKNERKNITVLNAADGRQVLLSYGTPVAAFVPGHGYVQTERKYSVTTSRHVNQWTERRGKMLTEAEFRQMIQGVL